MSGYFIAGEEQQHGTPMQENADHRICSNSWCGNLLPVEIGVSSNDLHSQRWRSHYRPLSEDETEIRLIQCQLDEFIDPIRCTLLQTRLVQSASLDESSSHNAKHDFRAQNGTFLWRALSYTWGPATNMRSESGIEDSHIFLNGDKMPVRPNLLECLKWLRHHRYADPIWIDALCIDQDNYLERNKQVQIMDQIYRLAGETIIYIPMNNMLCQESIELELEEANMFAGAAFDEKNIQNTLRTWAASNKTSPLFSFLAYILDATEPSSYWMRLWTLQECAFASGLTLCCGKIRLAWDLLNRIMSIAGRIRFELAERPAEDRASDAAEQYPEKMTQLMCGPVLDRNTLRSGAVEYSLEQLYRKYDLSLACSDPRDHIFALIGMVHSSYLRTRTMLADYSLCTSCVWRRATICTIQDTGRLDVLGFCGLYWDEDDVSKHRAESWTPPWSQVVMRQDDQNRFTGDADPEILSLNERAPLMATGFVYGALHMHRETALVSSDPSATKAELLQIRELFAAYPDAAIQQVSLDLSSIANKFFTSKTRSEEVTAETRRICLAALSDVDAYVTDTDAGVTARAFSYLSMTLMDAYAMVIVRDSAAPCFALGYSPYMQTGDIVCGILGCNTPLVVRRSPDGYRIIGWCLFGGAYGEGQAIVDLEAGRLTREVFTFK